MMKAKFMYELTSQYLAAFKSEVLASKKSCSVYNVNFVFMSPLWTSVVAALFAGIN